MSDPRRPSLRVPGAVFGMILAAASAARAGVNSWTAGRTLPPGSAPSIVAASEADPYVVYGVFEPDLYKSLDGGRTWSRLASFLHVEALLVDASPTNTSQDTVFVGGVDGPNGEYGGVLKSTDGGTTWFRKPFPGNFNYMATALAKAPGPDGEVFAGSFNQFFRSANGGDTWVAMSSLAAVVGALVVSPRDPAVIYSGSEADFYYFTFGEFQQSSDQGATWTDSPLGQVDSVSAIAAIDTDPTVFVGLSAERPQSERGIRRSIDGGQTFFHAENGLPTGTNVFSLVVDPAHNSTIYAGTDSGIYRSRDSGDTWWSMGQVLSGQTVQSLSLSGSQLHAGFVWGAFDLELASGPADVVGDSAGGARVLRWNSDRMAIQSVDGSNGWTSSPFSGLSQTWTAVAIAAGADGVPRVLWQNGDGRSSLETATPAGSSSVVFPKGVGIPSDVAVGPDGHPILLVTNESGMMSLATVEDGELVTMGHGYGPSPGWSAVALDVAPDGLVWVLWRSADGRAAVAIHGGESSILPVIKWSPTAGYAVEDIAIGTDGKARILSRSASGSMQIWKIGDDGSRSQLGGTYDREGFVPRRIATGSDGLVRVLWSGDGAEGHADSSEGEVWFLDSSGNHVDVEVPALP